MVNTVAIANTVKKQLDSESTEHSSGLDRGVTRLNGASYNYYSISRFFAGQILFYLDNPDPVERKTIFSLNPKKSKYPAGLDSKIRILYTTGLKSKAGMCNLLDWRATFDL